MNVAETIIMTRLSDNSIILYLSIIQTITVNICHPILVQLKNRNPCFSYLRCIVIIQPYLTRRLIILSFRAVARNLERLLMRPKPKIPRAARNDKVR